MLKVCLVEDDPGSRDVLGTWFQRYDKIELIAAFETGEQALKELPGKTPDVVLMDIRLPGISGIECVETLRRLSLPFHSRILVLTDHGDADLIFSAFRAGADGYLLKRDISPRELETAILQVLADGGPMSPHIARKVIANFQGESRENSSEAANQMTDSAGLSARQREVLELATRGLTYKEMASHLEISLDTVRKHLQGIYRKLHVQSRCDPLLYSVCRPHEDHPSQ